MNEKLKNCPVCGKEMAASAKVCPSCGAKNPKPIYKKWWFWVLLVLIIGGIGGAAGGGNKSSSQVAQVEEKQTEQSSSSQTSSQPEPSYISCTVDQLMDDLNSNALKAQETYKGEYVSLSGKLSNVDSSGKYISITAVNDPFAIIGVQCYVKNSAQKEKIINMTTGDVITVRGQIKDVGEVLGYSLDIADFGE